MKTLSKKIASLAGTAKLAKELAKKVGERAPSKGAFVLALSGELGAGKTTFTKSFLKELGVREEVTSPTFILFRPYPLPAGNFQLAYHIDCYRLEDPKELLKLGLKEMLTSSKHIIVIEWAERVKKFLPKATVWLSLEHVDKKGSRKIVIKGL